MLHVHDIRETRVYQEAKEEGLNEAIVKMAAKKMSAAKIAGILEVDIEQVKKSVGGRAEVIGLVVQDKPRGDRDHVTRP